MESKKKDNENSWQKALHQVAKMTKQEQEHQQKEKQQRGTSHSKRRSLL